MFPFVKQLRCFVSKAVAGDFRPFQTLVFPNVSQESRRSEEHLCPQGVQPRRLNFAEGHLTGQLPVQVVHGELDAAVLHSSLDELRMRPGFHVQRYEGSSEPNAVLHVPGAMSRGGIYGRLLRAHTLLLSRVGLSHAPGG